MFELLYSGWWRITGNIRSINMRLRTGMGGSRQGDCQGRFRNRTAAAENQVAAP